MAIKWKNKKKGKVIFGISVILVLTIVNLLYFPVIGSRASERSSQEMLKQQQVNMGLLQSLYEGALVLYYEQTANTSETVMEPMDLFVKKEELSNEQCAVLEESFYQIYGEMERDFENYRYKVDYYASNGKMSESNTAQDLAAAAARRNNEVLNELILHYRNLWVMQFDELGQLHISVMTSEDISPDMLVKGMKQAESNMSLAGRIQSYIEIENAEAFINKVSNFTVVYGVSEKDANSLTLYEDIYYLLDLQEYIEGYAAPAFILSVLVLMAAAFIGSNPKIQKEGILNYTNIEEKRRWFRFELVLVGVLLIKTWYHWYCHAIYLMENRGLKGFTAYIGGEFWELFRYFDIVLLVFVTFGILYLICISLCPMVYLGIKEYIRQQSFFYQIFPSVKKYWEKFKKEIEEINLEEDITKKIIKLVVINFLVLAGCCCFWVIGIFGLVIYSLLLFYLLSEYFYRITQDYEVLRKAVNRIAEGDLNTVISENIGMFEPMKEDLTRIRTGFKKAVEEEVKSQRMKTELISNVSHDLKTPLTAIMTYIELLKKEDITEEEQKEYIMTLERKAERLKVLIEDLFEVSKASSHDVALHFMKVDIVKLMKQVVVEHKEKYEEAGLTFYWNVPEEKMELHLDSQKTYRIFENLFLNIEKYAMKNSRVYISVSEEEGIVSIILRNMSAVPLSITGEELTERFVRGDISRNSEGSGLGLAIVKNFTEIQNGTFEVVVDGDLFKTICRWRRWEEEILK